MSHRIERVNALLRQEISNVIATELKDPRLASLVSVIRVATARDLRTANVYVSVMGDQAAKTNTLRALKSAAGFIHRRLRHSLDIRSVPALQFHLDESIERGAELLELIKYVTRVPEADESR